MELGEAQLYLLPIVVDESDPLPVIIVVPMDHDLGSGVMLGHALSSSSLPPEVMIRSLARTVEAQQESATTAPTQIDSHNPHPAL
jgi:hypothetical protein